MLLTLERSLWDGSNEGSQYIFYEEIWLIILEFSLLTFLSETLNNSFTMQMKRLTQYIASAHLIQNKHELRTTNIYRILRKWSFHMKFIKRVFGEFYTFHMKQSQY